MKSSFPFLATLLYIYVCACLFAACKKETTPTTPIPQPTTTAPVQEKTPVAEKKKTILFFGNSLTAAYGLSKEQGFPALIQEKLNAQKLPYQCINAGLSGETTGEGNERADWVLEQPVDVFVLELGANDAFRGIDTKTIEANLQSIINKVKSKYPEAKIVLAGMLAPPNLGKQYTQPFKEIYPRLARKNNALFIPFLLENVAGEKHLNQQDGIHPTAEGQVIVAENIWKVLQKAL